MFHSKNATASLSELTVLITSLQNLTPGRAELFSIRALTSYPGVVGEILDFTSTSGSLIPAGASLSPRSLNGAATYVKRCLKRANNPSCSFRANWVCTYS